MIGGYVGLAVGEHFNYLQTLEAAGTATITFTASGVGASTHAAAGSSSLTLVATGVGTWVIPSAGSSSIDFTAAGVGGSTHAAAGLATLTFEAIGASIILPIVSTKVVQKPVDVVLAGQQWKFKSGGASGRMLRGIFRE